MVQIDLAEVPVRQANELIREYGAQGEDIDIVNPDARHHIGGGLTDPITERVHGSAGYFCAGVTDAAGVAIRGADIVIRGNMGSRAGQVMKAGTLLCGGNANFMAG